MKKCLKGRSLSDPAIFNDPYLLAYADIISSRRLRAIELEEKIKQENKGSLGFFADYHKIFGLHFDEDKGSWVFREWAPNASEIFIVCEKTSWQKNKDLQIKRKDNHVFERLFPKETFSHGDLFRLKLVWPGGEGDRIPTAATRVVQDSHTLIFNAQVWHPQEKYKWKIKKFSPPKESLLIYETHVGMALEDGRIGTYAEFEHNILPKIADAGYNVVQLMAIQEHPYYGSFGYHVANFFAPSSRFGTPEEFKSLIDATHKRGIRVFMDIIHSHAVNNEVEGIAKFDGTGYQFFHDGPKGYHRQWDSRCFDYSKSYVLKFLLSNLKFWIKEFKIDGCRFDGITSMLFEDHGLGRAFTSYDDYYGSDVDVDALSYLFLANSLVHDINPDFTTIAEDVSGYPGLAAPILKGGTGFDYRYAMGIADFWIRLLKEFKDEQWHLGSLWRELTTKRKEEKTISYAESHDQALVGDKTLIMHLMGSHIYTSMKKDNESIETLRGVALHKMIRLITIATAGSGYLNFMGNEFGHPEWVDFPTEKNNYSFHYARRQWSLKYDKDLYFSCLFEFDKNMIAIVKDSDLFSSPDVNLLCIHEDDKVIAFERKKIIFVFNFHHSKSFSDYMFAAPAGEYRVDLNSDEIRFGGKGRLEQGQVHFTIVDPKRSDKGSLLSLYLPTRTVIILKLKT
ncbi:MAG: alpha amylase C-terminal domain-containing protein [Desulfobacula sp.]|uniref:alpha amylase C-terminal domain-containing protein n=1 Tax=Desulfobacula sp. TaxID=2593537 RepID=UPI0025B8D648|nr:alpha amylase C-terminal domain-containing protein [Desulfobacula sp.]MCD4722103.1 alpha amylase C-terminal domain-containing protein [Desulfobacula sp.]